MAVMTSETHLPVVQAEREALCDTFLELGPDAPTLCDPWRARDLAAHLVVRERRPDLAPGILLPALAGRLERGQQAVAEGDWESLVATVRSGPPWWSPTRIERVDALVNTVELVVHHEDVLRGDGTVGPRREVPERTERAVHAALRKSARLMFRRSPVGVRLVAPGAEPIHTCRRRGPAHRHARHQLSDSARVSCVACRAGARPGAVTCRRATREPSCSRGRCRSAAGGGPPSSGAP